MAGSMVSRVRPPPEAVMLDPPLLEEFRPESTRDFAVGRSTSSPPLSLPAWDCWDHCRVSRPTTSRPTSPTRST
eukprot:12936076-Prorocentrum_lima.AAC.1